jgi:hypothetical protein
LNQLQRLLYVRAPSQLSVGSFLKTNKSNGDPSNDEDKSGNAAAKPDRGAKPTGINRPTSIASKFVSYKDVAVSPPGTVLKPLLEQKEAKDKDNGLDSDLTLSSGEEDRKFTEKNKEKPDDESSKEAVSSLDGVSHVETTPDSDSDESPSATKKHLEANFQLQHLRLILDHSYQCHIHIAQWQYMILALFFSQYQAKQWRFSLRPLILGFLVVLGPPCTTVLGMPSKGNEVTPHTARALF